MAQLTEKGSDAPSLPRLCWDLPVFINGRLARVQSLGLFISTMLMVVEKERPQNRLFTAFEKSALELEQLARAMTEQWQAGVAAGTEPRHLLSQILTFAEKEEARVSKYIEDAESYLKETSLSRRIKSGAAKEFAAFR